MREIILKHTERINKQHYQVMLNKKTGLSKLCVIHL